MEFFERFVCTLTRRTAQAAQVALFFAMSIIVANVILRALWKPVPGTVEMVEMAGAVLLALGIAYTAIMKGHIAVEVLVERFSPRIQAIVNLVVNAIAIFFSFVLAKQMLVYAAEMAARNWSTGHLNLPIAPSIYLVAFGFGMLTLVLFLDLLKAVLKLINTKGSAS